MNLVIYGPPGSGKTTVGRLAAARLGREFVDGDDWIEARWGRAVADYFAAGEEALFRQREAEAYRALAARADQVLAPGGGALLDPHLRATLEQSGTVVCLSASVATLAGRLENDVASRPLLAGDLRARLAELLRARDGLYHSFAHQINTDNCPVERVADEAIAVFQAASRFTRFELGRTSALFGHGLLTELPRLLAAKAMRPPFIVIADSAVAALHGDAVQKALGAALLAFPSGETNKNLDTVRALYADCVRLGLERDGNLVAVGGGVAGDMIGFVAATYMRGVSWANLPTTVLAMADASLGGKVGVDLPEGKNLVGAFHPPALVAADFDFLSTLPAVEVRCGLAEILKAGIIGDAELFEGLPAGAVPLERAIVRAAAVKVGVVNADPFEHGERATLNLGHTIGHGVEAASGYRLRHGESVAIGMLAETRLAERIGLAEAGLAERVSAGLARLGLPTGCSGLDPAGIRAAMNSDKKRAGGRLKFALPRCPGEVVWGREVDEAELMAALEGITRAA